MSNTNKKTSERKQFELLHNALDVMDPELAVIEDIFHQGKQYSAHAQMQSSQIRLSSFYLKINASESWNVSFFLTSRGVSIGVTQTINLKFEKLGIFIFTNKHMDKKQIFSPPPRNRYNITFHMAPNQFGLSTLGCIFVPNFMVLPIWNNWNKIRPLTSGLYIVLFYRCIIICDVVRFQILHLARET